MSLHKQSKTLTLNHLRWRCIFKGKVPLFVQGTGWTSKCLINKGIGTENTSFVSYLHKRCYWKFLSHSGIFRPFEFCTAKKMSGLLGETQVIHCKGWTSHGGNFQRPFHFVSQVCTEARNLSPRCWHLQTLKEPNILLLSKLSSCLMHWFWDWSVEVLRNEERMRKRPFRLQTYYISSRRQSSLLKMSVEWKID